MTSFTESMPGEVGSRPKPNVGAWAPDELVWGGPPAEPEPEPGQDAMAEQRAAAEAEALAAKHAAELEEAYARGFADGKAEEAARLETAVAAAERAIAEVRATEAPRLEALESNTAALAVAIARHMIGRELSAEGAEIIADLVRRALAHFPVSQPVRVRVHPADLSLISTVGPDSGGPIPIGPGRDVRWLADPRVERGGCVVEGTDRLVDGRVDLALERIYRALTDA